MGCEKICSIDGCEKILKAKGFCHAHYRRFLRYGDPLGGGPPRVKNRSCSVDGCSASYEALGFCAKHYTRFKKTGTTDDYPERQITCSVKDCNNKHYGKTFCQKHYLVAKKSGDPLFASPIMRVHDPLCSVEGCEKPFMSRGFCSKHYDKWKKYDNPLVQKKISYGSTCTISGCGEKHCGKGFCKLHLYSYRKYDDPLAVEIRQSLHTGLCSFTDCDQRHHALGYCVKHHYRLKKYGDPGASLKISRRSSLREVFDHHESLKTVTVNGCWIGPNRINNGGYSIVSAIGKQVALHRLSAHFFLGFDLESKKTIHHKCSNKACFNPDHLQDVTLIDNIAEMRERLAYRREIARLEKKLIESEKKNEILSIELERERSARVDNASVLM